jgi:acyl-CoA-binding protein
LIIFEKTHKMALADLFADAQERVKTLTERPGNEELLDLYALFKQATEGDNHTDEPGMFDMKGKFKWKQWDSKRGMSADQAMQAYVDLVNGLLSKYSHS